MAVTYTGFGSTQRIIGDAQPFQGLAIIENARGSNRLLRVIRLSSQLDSTTTAGASTLFTPCLTYRSAGNPTLVGCAKAGKGTADTAQTSDPFINIWYAVTPDGANVSGMVGNIGTLHWRQWANKLRSAAEQQQSNDNNQLPMLVDKNRFLLYPGESLIVRTDAVVTGDNSSGAGWIVNCAWQEEDLQTYTIGGVVTLSAVGVVGAEITVLVADNTALTNAYLWKIVQSTTGGAWTCEIPIGKVAYAYAQDFVTGTYYTAQGAPYIT